MTFLPLKLSMRKTPRKSTKGQEQSDLMMTFRRNIFPKIAINNLEWKNPRRSPFDDENILSVLSPIESSLSYQVIDKEKRLAVINQNVRNVYDLYRFALVIN